MPCAAGRLYLRPLVRLQSAAQTEATVPGSTFRTSSILHKCISSGPSIVPACMRQPTVPALYMAVTGTIYSAHGNTLANPIYIYQAIAPGTTSTNQPELLLRGAIVNRTYGIHKNLYITIFTNNFGPINYDPPQHCMLEFELSFQWTSR